MRNNVKQCHNSLPKILKIALRASLLFSAFLISPSCCALKRVAPFSPQSRKHLKTAVDSCVKDTEGHKVFGQRHPIPKRDKDGKFVFPDYPRFKPNLSPKQVLQMGSFGGTYFRPIKSGVTGEYYKNQWMEFPDDWFDGLVIKKMVEAPFSSYDSTVNKYGVKCGQTVQEWESSGWIKSIDPYGWFQWYCRFFLGRRSSDDDRQVSRALGVMSEKGRFRNQLIGKLSKEGKSFDNYGVSPVIRQTLQHWGYQLTERDADDYLRSKSLPPLPRNNKKKRSAGDAGFRQTVG